VEEIAREIAERSKWLAEHAGRQTVKEKDVRLAVKEWRSHSL
jgi:histone H3/H4